MPAASMIARTAPPAITPVPGEAGFRTTEDAPNRPRISCGIVSFTSGTSNMPRFADSSPFRIASGTSFAFPRLKPTRPLPSPTTTMALKENRRPPLTTFATRLIWTTLSINWSWLDSTANNCVPPLYVRKRLMSS